MKLKHSLVAGATLGLVAVAGPALATGSASTVAVGGNSTAGQSPVTATSDGPLTFQAEKPDGTFLTMNCTSGNVPASPASYVNRGTGVTNIATLNKVNFVSCTGPGGALTVTTAPPWQLHRTGAVTAGATDVIAGHLEGIRATARNPVCSFTVTGGADGTFNEGNQKLTINETANGSNDLTVSGVTGCLGQVKNGGKAKFSGTFTTTTSGGAVNVKP